MLFRLESSERTRIQERTGAWKIAQWNKILFDVRDRKREFAGGLRQLENNGLVRRDTFRLRFAG
jgi:hypothetical protein